LQRKKGVKEKDSVTKESAKKDTDRRKKIRATRLRMKKWIVAFCKKEKGELNI